MWYCITSFVLVHSTYSRLQLWHTRIYTIQDIRIMPIMVIGNKKHWWKVKKLMLRSQRFVRTIISYEPPCFSIAFPNFHCLKNVRTAFVAVRIWHLWPRLKVTHIWYYMHMFSIMVIREIEVDFLNGFRQGSHGNRKIISGHPRIYYTLIILWMPQEHVQQANTWHVHRIIIL